MKRSGQIALVLMGATAVGTTSYALTPRDCRPPNNLPAQQVAAPPGAAQPNQECRRRWSSSSSGSRWGSSWRSSSRSSATATTTSVARSSTAAYSSGTVSVARGGFGSTGHAVSGGS